MSDQPSIPPIPSDINGVWAWAAALSDEVARVAKLRAERRAERRRARAKARYAARKAAGTLPLRGKAKAEAEAQKRRQETEERRWRDEYEPEGCTCFLGHPPCGWCTREINEDDES